MPASPARAPPLVLALLALLALAPPPTAALAEAPGPAALASGPGTFTDVARCSSPASFLLEIGAGVGNLRWIHDCPGTTGSANFALVCQAECTLPPFCAGDASVQRCEYQAPDATGGMSLTLARDGTFAFHADFPGRKIRAEGVLTVHTWPVA